MSKNRPTLTLNRPAQVLEKALPDSENASASVEGDLVDRIFELLAETLPPDLDLDEARRAIRAEFGGETAHVHKIAPAEKAEHWRKLRHEVLRLFNGRNASEIARKLGVSRPFVYRVLKQAPYQKS